MATSSPQFLLHFTILSDEGERHWQEWRRRGLRPAPQPDPDRVRSDCNPPSVFNKERSFSFK